MNPLTTVRRATAKRTSSETAWRESIRQARESGATLREIAGAAGVTHPRIIQLLKRKDSK